MGAVRQDITKDHAFFIGEDRQIKFDVNQEDGSTAQTMTGWALTWELLTSPGAATASITKTTAGGTITIGNGDGTGDRATVTIADTDTEALDPGKYYHRLRRTDAGNEIILAYGSVLLQETGL